MSRKKLDQGLDSPKPHGENYLTILAKYNTPKRVFGSALSSTATRAPATSRKSAEGRSLKKSTSKNSAKSKARRHDATTGPNEASAAKVQSMNQSSMSVKMKATYY
ncbi:hypothetical protein RRF57_008858 [Xylaria bambusicola]|uniref:Uncharacterized protein n=1 Tax=Xylaria bambusicola TaxID=326684 RepID=A0AAN7USR9_9PEZI